MSSNLNKSGYESYRNKAKPWRPQRIDKKTGKIHTMDNLRLGLPTEEHPTGRPVNSTGCFGIKSSGMQIRASPVIKKGAPGRDRPARKRKNVSKLYRGNVRIEFDKLAPQRLLSARNDIYSYKVFLELLAGGNKLDPKINDIFERLNKHLSAVLSDKDFKSLINQDVHRYKSIQGMIRSGTITSTSLRNQTAKLQKTLSLLKMSSNERDKDKKELPFTTR